MKKMKTFLSSRLPIYTGDFMKAAGGSIVVIVITIIFILILNPSEIRSDYLRIGSLIIGIAILLMGTTGASKYRRSDRVGASIITIMAGTILILYGLGFINANQ